MTTIEFIKNQDGAYRQIVCMGHAGFAKKHLFYKEPDILCSAISALMISSLNALEELAGEKFQTVTNEETGFIKVDFDSGANLQEKSVFLLDALVFSLENLSKEYGEQYLQVKIKEV